MKGKKPLRQQLAENHAALSWMCNMGGKPAPEQALVLPPKKVRAPAKPSTIPTEHQEQAAFCKWFSVQHKGVRLFAIPNAAMRTPQLAAYLKAEGMSSGVPDLCIPAMRTWIEFKRVKGGVVSPEQADWHEYLRGIGDRVIVARGCDDAIKQLDEK